MQNSESIWKKPIYLPYLQPKLTDESLDDAEYKLGYKLPKEMIELLNIQNGGYIRPTLEECNNTQIYGAGDNFPSLLNFDWEEVRDWVSFELNGLIPFDGDGHWHLCLDYRKNKIEPQITYIDIECNEQKEIADTFKDYLSKLSLNVDDELVIQTDKPIEQVAKEIEKILDIKFENSSTYYYGYLLYRSKLKDSWIWLSPNLVPFGFVRENDSRYKELIELTNGTALRFPEIKKTFQLLKFSKKDVENLAIDKMRNEKMNVQQLKEIIDL